MDRAVFEITSEQDTEKFGQLLASVLRPGDVIGLSGDLGAGKTFLSGAVARALGVPDAVPVSSPTFTLINEYFGRMPVYHMDLYRIGEADELYELGLWEYYDGDGVCLVEWCDRFDELWPEEAALLSIELGEGERRSITAEGVGRGGQIVTALQGAWSPSAG